MEAIHILEYERWKKFNDPLIGKNSVNFASLNKNMVAAVKEITNEDGFVKQHIIGAGDDKNISTNTNSNSTKSKAKTDAVVMVFSAK